MVSTFVAFDILPKNGIKKREINKIITLPKERAQLLPHHKGGKLIYNKLVTKSPPALDWSSIAELVELSENDFFFLLCYHV